jgi:protoporphyrinogen oxidase
VGQAYNQALATYGADQSAQQNENAAQAQAYEQAMNQYQTAYQNSYQDYLQPLNSMNAVLTGQQVSMPQMPGFTAAGYTPGADYSGAASSLGQYNSGIYAQNSANASSVLGTVGSLGAAAIMAY